MQTPANTIAYSDACMNLFLIRSCVSWNFFLEFYRTFFGYTKSIRQEVSIQLKIITIDIKIYALTNSHSFALVKCWFDWNDNWVFNIHLTFYLSASSDINKKKVSLLQIGRYGAIVVIAMHFTCNAWWSVSIPHEYYHIHWLWNAYLQ